MARFVREREEFTTETRRGTEKTGEGKEKEMLLWNNLFLFLLLVVLFLFFFFSPCPPCLRGEPLASLSFSLSIGQ